MGERFLRTSATAQAKKEVLRVKRIKVEGLFGLYNHDIPLNSEERVTILHGPNGVGKTVLLKMIAAVFGGQYGQLSALRFKTLELHLSDATILTVQSVDQRQQAIEPKRNGLLLSSSLSGKTLNSVEFKEPEKVAIAFIHEPSELLPPPPPFIPPPPVPEEWSNTPYPPGLLPPRMSRFVPQQLEPEWLSKYRSLIRIHVIETQRLLRTTEPAYGEGPAFLMSTVRDYAQELQTRITGVLAQYASESQALDQSFPQRLLKMRSGSSLAAPDIKTLLTALDEKRAHLRKIGLLDNITSAPFEMEELDNLDPVQSNAIALYTEDTKKKLRVLEDIANRVNLFLNYINGKFRNKSIQISRENGFVVLGHDGQPIEPDALSSGEQHELVQLYDLLFRVRRGTLVLLDEPELSLHVRWQKKYLAELLEIAKTAEFDAIVATHSPFIVGDRSDLMVPLDADIDT